MTLNKYIRRLVDKLDPTKQHDRAVAAENARKARPNHPIVEYVPHRYHRVYGFAHWLRWGKRGRKNAQGKLLPQVREL